MAAKRSRARNFSGGGSKVNLGSILSGGLGGGDVSSTPSGSNFQLADKPNDWSGKNIPTSGIKTKILTSQDMSDNASGDVFKAKSPFWDAISGGKGGELATKANIENKLAEETAQRGIRTKTSEIPIEAEAAKQRETAISGPLIDRHKALLQLTNDAQLQSRLKIDPLDIEKARKENSMAILTAKGIQPTEENLAKHDALISGINLSEQAQKGFQGIAESRLGTANAERALGQESTTRAIDLDTEQKKSQLGNILAKGNVEAQPLLQEQRMKIIPGMAESEYYKNLKERLYPLRPEESVADIGTGKIAFKAPLTTGEQLLKNTQVSSGNIQPKTSGPGSFFNPNSNLTSTNVTSSEGSVTQDPTDPNYNIIIVGGRKIRVPKQ